MEVERDCVLKPIDGCSKEGGEEEETLSLSPYIRPLRVGHGPRVEEVDAIEGGVCGGGHFVRREREREWERERRRRCFSFSTTKSLRRSGGRNASHSRSRSNKTLKARRHAASKKKRETTDMLPRSSAAMAPSRLRYFSLDSRARCPHSWTSGSETRRPSLEPPRRRQRRRLPCSVASASLSSEEASGRSSPQSTPSEIARGVPWPRRLLGGRIDDSEGSAKDVSKE